MKRYILTLVAIIATAIGAKAMSYETAREEALYLTDKMAYELNLNDAQYEYAYEINLDYLMGLNTVDDVYGNYLSYRNADLRAILYDWQWTIFAATDYFFHPVYWRHGSWYFPIYGYYDYGHYYYSRPNFFYSYRGGHCRDHYRDGWYVSRRPSWNGGLRGIDRTHVGPGHGHAMNGGHRGNFNGRPNGMGGNRPGNFNGGNRPGNYNGGNRPGNFNGGNRPGNFNGGNRPGGNEGGHRPGGTEGGNRPDGGNSGTINNGSSSGSESVTRGGFDRPSNSTRGGSYSGPSSSSRGGSYSGPSSSSRGGNYSGPSSSTRGGSYSGPSSSTRGGSFGGPSSSSRGGSFGGGSTRSSGGGSSRGGGSQGGGHSHGGGRGGR